MKMRMLTWFVETGDIVPIANTILSFMSVGSFQKKKYSKLYIVMISNLNAKELQRQSQIITSKQLKNNESYIAFVFSISWGDILLFQQEIKCNANISLISGILGYYLKPVVSIKNTFANIV